MSRARQSPRTSLAPIPNAVPREHLPTPLAQVLDALDAETQAFRAVHRLIDTVEVLVKLHTVVLVSAFADALATQSPELLPLVRKLLAEGLRTPSLGLWWAFARNTGVSLAAEKLAEPSPGFFAAVGPGSALFKAIEGNGNLVTFRNGYAHGATPDDDACATDLASVGARVRALCDEARALGAASFVAIDRDGRARLLRGSTPQPCDAPAGCEPGHVYLLRDGAASLDLHPLLLWIDGPRGDGAYFYNDLKKNDAGALHYAWAQHTRSKSIAADLLRRFPLDAWRGVSLEAAEEHAILERIAALTESFKGRRAELAKIVASLGARSRGVLLLWGAPGVGKSALLARVLQYLEWQETVQREAYPNLEPPSARGSEDEGAGSSRLELALVRFFVRRGAYADVREIFETLGRQLDRRFRLSTPGAATAAESARLLGERIRAAAAQLHENQRLVLVIDGLDEAAEHADFLRGLPKEAPDKVHLVYASRPQPVVRSEVYDVIDPRLRSEIELGGLGRDDTRALLYEHVDKYAMQDAWVNAVVARSGGNALYLRLLCDSLDRGEVAFNDVVRLPTSMADLYATVLRRVSATPGAASMLALMAAAHAYLPEGLLAELLSLEVPDFRSEHARAAVEACAEVLMDDPATPERDWQLFHESLREYLFERLGAEVRGWQARLAEWSVDWRRFEGRAEAESYALRWGVTHLEERRTHAAAAQADRIAVECEERVLALIDDLAWRERTMRVCGNAEALRRGIRIAQRVAVRRHRAKPTDDSRARVARYVEWTWGEEVRLFERQRRALRDAHRRPGRWREVHELARVGATAKERALLAVLSWWGDRGERDTAPEFGDAALAEIRGWFDEADDTALFRLARVLGGLPWQPTNRDRPTQLRFDTR